MNTYIIKQAEKNLRCPWIKKKWNFGKLNSKFLTNVNHGPRDTHGFPKHSYIYIYIYEKRALLYKCYHSIHKIIFKENVFI